MDACLLFLKIKMPLEKLPLLNIITAVSRPENLYIMKAVIEQELRPYFKTTWYCVYDPGKDIALVDFNDPWIVSIKGGMPNDVSGASQRNTALDTIQNGWNWCMDDDNVVYEGFGKVMSEKVSENPGIEAFVFNQPRPTGDLIANPDNIKIGSIDVAQIFFKNKLIGKKRFFPEVYQSDYYFIIRIYKRNENKFVFLNQNLCHYNFLRK